MISGRVQLKDGTAWSFTDPALVVDEAEDLPDWLQDDARATAAGTGAGGAAQLLRLPPRR